MTWHDIRDPQDPELDRLAELHGLHPLHVEDCRHRGQNAKLEISGDYLFVVLKPVQLLEDGSLDFTDLDLFLGRDYLITVQEGVSAQANQTLDGLRQKAADWRPDRTFYHLMDAIVDSYVPMLDHLEEITETLEDEVLSEPSPEALERIFRSKRNLVELRRMFANTRDVANHLQRTPPTLISADLGPFLRDVYDHVTRNLEAVEMQRDFLTGALEIYLSSVAQRTNYAMKVLTVLGTIALPALVLSSFYGMNLQGLPWSTSLSGGPVVMALIAVFTLVLLLLLKLLKAL